MRLFFNSTLSSRPLFSLFLLGTAPLLLFILLTLLYGNALAAPTEPSYQTKEFKEAVALFQQGKNEEAEARFLEILRKAPEVYQAEQYLGMLYSRLKRWEEAKGAFESVIRKAPTFAVGYFGLGFVFKNEGNLPQAEAFFKNAITLAPDQYQSWFHLGQVLEAQRRMAEAVESYQKVIEHAPAGSFEFAQAEGRLRELGDTPDVSKEVERWVAEAERLLKEGKINEGWALYEKAARLLPKSLTLRLFMGNLALQLGNLPKAEAVFREATEIEPAAIPPHLSLAKIEEQLGKSEEAIREYETVLLLNHDETIPEIASAKAALFNLLDRKEIGEWTQKGEALMQEGKGGEALQAFLAAAAIDPALPVVHHNLARFYDRIGRPDLLLQTVGEALLIEPESRSLHLLLGRGERARRAFRASIAAYIKSLSLAPEDRQSSFYLEAQAGLLESGFEMRKAEIEAVRPFLEGLKKKGEGAFDEAGALLQQAARLFPENAAIQYALGDLYMKKGEGEKGAAALERGIALHSGFYPAWMSLYRYYLTQGRYEKAAEALAPLLSLLESDLTALGLPPETLAEEKESLRQKREEGREKSRALFNEAQEALAAGEKERGITLLQAAQQEEKDNLSILHSLGIAYAIAEKWTEAADTFTKILEIHPLHASARLRLGAAREAQGALPAAAQNYRHLLLQKERIDPAERQEGERRLAAVNEKLKRLREAERHEKRGFAVLNLLSEIAAKKGSPAPADGASPLARPAPARLQLALWDFRQAILLRPEEGRYHYNLGLFLEHLNFGEAGLSRENAQRVKKEPRLLDEPVAAYQKTIEIDPNYLPAYARLGQLYEWQEKNDVALSFYTALLDHAPSPPSKEVEEIKARVKGLQRRLSGSVGFLAGVDSNFNLGEPARDESFTTLSTALTYRLVRHPRFQIPLSYDHNTSFYYRSQIYSSNHGLSLGFRHQPTPSLSYGLTGRYQISAAKNGGVSLLLSQGTASASYFRDFPTVTSVEYGYSDYYFRRSSRLDAREQRATGSLIQAISLWDEADMGYTFTDRQAPRSPDNSYQSHRLQLGYRRWITSDVQLQGSGSVSFQNFPNPDSRENQIRRNTLLSYSVGIYYPFLPGAGFSLGYQFQKNRSNLGRVLLTQEDIILGRSTALGDYEKRTLTAGVNVAF